MTNIRFDGIQANISTKLNSKQQKDNLHFCYNRLLSEDVFVKNSDNPINKTQTTFKNALLKKFSPAFTGPALENIQVKQTNFQKNLVNNLITELKNETDLETTITLIGKLKVEQALPKLVEILERKGTPSNIAVKIIQALGNYKSNESLKILFKILQDSKYDANLRSETANILANTKNRKVIKPLLNIIKSDQESNTVKAAAINALGNFKSIRNAETLMSFLNHENPAIRANAALSLGQMEHKPASDNLIKLLSDKNNNVIISASKALAQLKEEKAIPHLINTLNSEEINVIKAAIKALKNTGYDCSKCLLAKLNNKNASESFRQNLIITLRYLNLKDTEKSLINILSNLNESDQIRKDTIKALVGFRSEKALQSYENIINNDRESTELKTEATIALMKRGNSKSLLALIKVLEQGPSRDLKLDNLKAISSIAHRNLIKENIDINIFLRELNSIDIETKALVLEIAGALRSKEAGDTLIEVLQNESNSTLKGVAARSLGLIQEERAIKPLLEIIKSDDSVTLKTQAAISLCDLGKKETIYDIIKTKNTPYETKKALISGLISIGDKSELVKNYMKPALNIPTIHKLGITGKNVEVAVIDKPVDLTHSEFEDRVIIKPLEHGTLVAGNIAGKNTGTAPESIVHSYNAFNDKEIGVGEIIEKIVDEKIQGKNNIKVINISLGYNAKYYKDKEVLEEVNKSNKAINLAEKAGITVVIAAGNEGLQSRIKTNNIGTLNLLAFNPNALVVGAIDTNGTPHYMLDDFRANFSSFPLTESKRQIDVMAPGVKIELPFPGGSYKVASGTSFSTPFISGLIALMHEANPDITTDQIKSILNKNTLKLKDTPEYKQGRGETIPYKVIYEAMKLNNIIKAEEFKAKFEKMTNI